LACYEDITQTGQLIATNLLHQLDPTHHSASLTTLLPPPPIEVLHE